jgi:4-amino-4-deoxy-L-arabinose transferase-like glycosyltransferase
METMANFFSFKTPRLGRIMQFLKNHSAIIAILIGAAVLRLYKIADYMTFLGDEGRDVLVVKHILQGDLTFLGPRASAGDFFLGPIYYYMMAPFLWIWRYDPVGPAVMVAIFGIVTVFLVYLITMRFFDKTAGVAAAALYAVSSLVIVYSRSSWNPNVMPFFTLVTLYLLYLAAKKENKKYFIGVGILLGIILQLHYLGTFVAVIIALFTFLSAFLKKSASVMQLVKRWMTNYISIFLGFLIGFSPFLAFEIKNNFPNLRTIFGFIFQNTVENEYVNASYFSIVHDTFIRVFGRLLTNYPVIQDLEKFDGGVLQLWRIGIIILALSSIFLVFRMKDKLQMLLLLTWIGAGIVLFGVYKKPIYDYYFGFLFPAPFIVFGNLFSTIYSYKSRKKVGVVLACLLLCVLMGAQYYNSLLRYPPNRQRDQMKLIADFVISKTDNQPFNFALVTGGNSDHAYRYFFESADRTPVTIENLELDPARNSVTEQLLVVCEYPECDVLGHSLWEIAGFGRAEVVGDWPVSVVRVYKLVPYTATDSAAISQ